MVCLKVKFLLISSKTPSVFSNTSLFSKRITRILRASKYSVLAESSLSFITTPSSPPKIGGELDELLPYPLRGLIYNVDMVKDSMKAAKEFIEKVK